MGLDERPANDFTKKLALYRRLIGDDQGESEEALALRRDLQQLSPRRSGPRPGGRGNPAAEAVPRDGRGDVKRIRRLPDRSAGLQDYLEVETQRASWEGLAVMTGAEPIEN